MRIEPDQDELLELIVERADLLMDLDDAYPEVGAGLHYSFWVKRAAEQVEKDAKRLGVTVKVRQRLIDEAGKVIYRKRYGN